MILDRQVLCRVEAQWKTEGLFRSGWSNLIAGWCVDYFKEYNEPPGRAIETLYHTWADSANNKTTADMIGDFLGSLSEEYEKASEVNSDYLIDLAGRHFNGVLLEALADGIQADLVIGKQDSALERIAQWNRVELGAGSFIDVMNDMEAIREAFKSKSEPIISFPGALGEFFGNSLERDGFIGIMGSDKKGKSFWLAELAYQALLQRRKIAFFECGDLSQDQILRRLMIRISGRPAVPETLNIPKSMMRDRRESLANVEFREKVFDAPLSWQKAWKAVQEVMTRKVKSKEAYWRLSIHPNSTISVKGIRAILSGWEREGWSPDVVVIDYADILAADNGRLEYRHQINETWKQMRAMSQSLHCLVVTASQTDADAYNRNIITRSNFSDDKRKIAHVTGMIGLNQTEEEKGYGITRLNWVVRREGSFSERQCVHVAGNLAIANPAIVSCW
jgi:hypothetical protein